MHRSFRGICVLVLLLNFLGAASSSAWAEDDPCAKQEPKPAAATPERIKQRAQAIRDLKALLADADATVRLAALDTMLNSCDSAAREIAYEVGFASGDQAMRALTFKNRILSWSQFVAESLSVESPSREQSALLTCCLRLPVRVDQRNMARGEFTSHATSGSVSGLELAVTYSDLILRLRLQDGAVAEGTLTRAGASVPARLVLR